MATPKKWDFKGMRKIVGEIESLSVEEKKLRHPLYRAGYEAGRAKGQEEGAKGKFFSSVEITEPLPKDIYDKIFESGRAAVDENTSDGYHTFKELYEFRKLYNAALFNEWAHQGKYSVHKSTKHSDGEDCFGGGWFIVVATLPAGDISNHYEMKDWDLFKCEERETAKEWDGHTAQDVLNRLSALSQPQKNKKEL